MIQSRVVIEWNEFRYRFVAWMRGIVRALLWLARASFRQWKVWGLTICAFALLGAVQATSAPPRWESEGYILLRPVLLREGYLLSTDELSAYYLLRLASEERMRRALTTIDEGAPSDTLLRQTMARTEARALGQGILRLRVQDSQPERAEAIMQRMLRDFVAEVRHENRSRELEDRLRVEVAGVGLARRVDRLWWQQALLAAALGSVVGWVVALAWAWRQQRRIYLPLEAEQLTGVPTLSAIPRR